MIDNAGDVFFRLTVYFNTFRLICFLR